MQSTYNKQSLSCRRLRIPRSLAYGLFIIVSVFKDSPARREDYLKLSPEAKFPEKLCRHGWIENVSVLKRVLDILPNIKKYILNIKKWKISKKTLKALKLLRNTWMACSKLNVIL